MQLQQRSAAMRASSNELLAICAPTLQVAEQSYRQALAKLRLLRIAVALHRGCDAPQLHDPFGVGPLSIVTERDRTTIKSAGERGGKSLSRAIAR